MSKVKLQGRLAPFFLPIRGKLPLPWHTTHQAATKKSPDILGIVLKEGRV